MIVVSIIPCVYTRITMTNNEFVYQLSKFLCQDYQPVDYIIWFGSKKDGADIDLMVITSSSCISHHFAVGNIDLAAFQTEDFSSLARLLDPMAIEPLFFGEVIYQKDQMLGILRKEIRNKIPDDNVIYYLRKRSVEEYLSSNNLIESSQVNMQLLWSLINLSYADLTPELAHL